MRGIMTEITIVNYRFAYKESTDRRGRCPHRPAGKGNVFALAFGEIETLSRRGDVGIAPYVG